VLPMQTALSHWPDNGVGVEHGPLVYSLPVKEEWTALVIPRYSTSDFPCWNAMAASSWNYGLAIDEEQLSSEIQVRRKPMTEDPWIEPPIIATVPLKKIEGWELSADEKDQNQKYTPSLPDVTKHSVAAETERIALVPYGATHLRLTIFPDVSASGDSTKAAKPV